MSGTYVSTLEDYSKRDKSVTDFTRGGKCSQCGGCCTNQLQLTSQEIKQIRNYVKKHRIKPHVINLPTVDPCMDVTCPFLNTDKKTERCNIYPVRPYICQVFTCSQKDMSEYVKDPKLMNRQYTTIDMRKTFFPDTNTN